MIYGSLKRQLLRRASNRLDGGITANIAYLGGSITNGTGASVDTNWRALTAAWLDNQYRLSDLTHYNAGVGGTPSWYGLVRLQSDVIVRAPEIVTVDFAVNDPDDDSKGSRSGGFAPAAEALIRRLRTDLPNTSLIGWIFTWPDSYSHMVTSRRSARNKWTNIFNRYNVPVLRFDLEIERLSETRTPTDEQVNVYLLADNNVHPSEAGHLVAHKLLRRHVSPYYADADTSAQMAAMPARLYAEAEDYEEIPQITNGEDMSTTGAWSTVGTAISSSEADATASFTGTFCSFGLDADVGAGQGTVGWSLDGGEYTNIDLSAEPVANFPVSNFASDSHTVALKVVSGTIQINRFLAI